jgi:hypothetical protein
MSDAIFAELRDLVTQQGPMPAVDRLCELLGERGDYHSLFYALLMRKRLELGVSPVPTGPSQDLPEACHGPYEEAIRQAGRRVGQLYLDAGDISKAWIFFRMINEPAPVAAALDKVNPPEGEDLHPLVQVAYYEGVNPRKGFDLILDRFGLCNAVTTLGGQEFPHSAEIRRYCIGRLVRSLSEELKSRLSAEIAGREGKPPDTSGTLETMLNGRDWLFEDEFAHIDVSHLSAVVQMSIHLEPGPDLDLARQLCAYGRRLAPRLQYAGEPPFEDTYRDYGVYLDVLAGKDVEGGLDHFRKKVDTADPDLAGTLPAEALVNLLLRLNRTAEAVAVSRKHLAAVEGRRLSCPSLVELCQKAGDYETLAAAAEERGDVVHFTAGLLATGQARLPQ